MEEAEQLVTAIFESDFTKIQELIKHSVAINQEINEKSPLAIAIEEGKLEIAKVLIDAGANVNWRYGWYDPLLVSFARSGNLEAVKLLVEVGANLDLKDDDGHTALYSAALYENQAIYDYLYNLSEPSDYRDCVDKVILPNASETTRTNSY